MNQKYRMLLIALVALLVAVWASAPIWASPEFQTATRFRSIIIAGDADFDGDIDVDGISNLDAVDVDGNKIDLDLDADTSITVDTDDQIDVEISGADEWVITADEMDATNGQIVNIGAAGTDFTSDGSLTIATDLTVDDTLNIDDTDSLLTGAQTITPTYSFLQVSPTAVLTITLGTTVDGDFLIVHNTVTTSTVIIDTGATQGGGNITLGQDDVAGFIFADGVWVELFSPDNS